MKDHFSAFATLFVTIDPVGLAPLFLAVTHGMSRVQRRSIAVRASMTALGILLLFALARTAILALFGITIAAFRIAGGLLLFHIAFEMIFDKRQERHEKSAERAITVDQVRNLAIFPLAIPLIAGPGAISATILLSGAYADWPNRLVLLSLVALNLLAAWAIFLLAEGADRFLGVTSRIVLTRLLGLILAALSVQFVIDGVAAVMRAGA